MKMSHSSEIARNGKAIEATVGSETILMMIESGECIGLGETGSEVWRQLVSPLSIAKLVDRLRGIYDAPAGVIEKDVEELLVELSAHHLILIG